VTKSVKCSPAETKEEGEETVSITRYGEMFELLSVVIVFSIVTFCSIFKGVEVEGAFPISKTRKRLETSTDIVEVVSKLFESIRSGIEE
jgi:hypothetical protein